MPRLSPVSDCASEDIEASDIQAAEDAYTTLVRLGGRPSQPVEYRADLTPQSWSHFSGQGARLRGELEKWKIFREFQFSIRQELHCFQRTQKQINMYWSTKKLQEEWRPRLNRKAQQQSKVEEWKEFYYFQHTRLNQKHLHIEQACQEICEDESSPKSKYLTAEVVKAAIKDRDVWKEWLEWIEAQFSIIVAENAQIKKPQKRRALHNKNRPAKHLGRRYQDILTTPSVVNKHRGIHLPNTESYSYLRRSCRLQRPTATSIRVNSPGSPPSCRRSSRIAQKNNNKKSTFLI